MTTMTAPFAINDRAMVDVLRRRGYHPSWPEPYGPSGVRLAVYRTDPFVRGSIIVTQAEHPYPNGVDWIHASLAWPDVMPTYGDLTALHRAVFGRRRWSYQVFAPDSRHVNIHNYALHLWGRADGKNVLPDFGVEGTI